MSMWHIPSNFLHLRVNDKGVLSLANFIGKIICEVGIPSKYFYSWAIDVAECELHCSFCTMVETWPLLSKYKFSKVFSMIVGKFIPHQNPLTCRIWNKGQEKRVYLPSSVIAHNGPTHLPFTHRILHVRRSPSGPTSPENLLHKNHFSI